MKLLQYLVFIILTSSVACGATSITHGFFVTEKNFSFIQKLKRIKCSGEIPYPYFTNDDHELTELINHHVEDFIQKYEICNKDNKKYYRSEFEIPDSNNKDFFSILWKTYKYGKIWRIDTINLNAENGSLLNIESVFHVHTNNLMHEIAKLSQGHLDDETTWDEFLEKIQTKDIQLYLKDNDWYIVFNSTPVFEEVFELKLPKYFLTHITKHDR